MQDYVVLIAVLVTAAIVGFLVLAYLVSNNKITGEFRKPATVIVATVTIVFFLGFAGLIVTVLYDKADESGWFSHDRTVSVLMNHDWLVGEFKSCSLTGDSKTPVLTCGTSNVPTHEMDVSFRGSLDQLEKRKQSNWNCQRKQESIACKTDSNNPALPGWSSDKTVETWYVRDPATKLVQERKYTLAQAIDFCNKNPKMEIATSANATANGFAVCPAFVSEFH